ncbi:hypothetical protein BN59_03807 [Legionella massiliensis]|uniref:Insertion element IS402-like domain-containing protein n=1 Tax=Legionella massiliensis TaxID=1034943 RepID=A0A078L603_9GAMM|nr:transposase [Legionella massiliensis]CDZ79489.1 hypothetical protein BN59_03807 [Legionella massiliensis]CEE15227.1 hypothetical protein BN1094_03807 [Legionella massiliensis]
MSGRFVGLSDVEWLLFSDVLDVKTKKRSRGMPAVSPRKVLNTLLYILISGCRWCDVPQNEIFASKSSSHRWLTRWEADGTLESLRHRILEIASANGLIRWEHGAVDGSFSPWQRRR